MGEILALRNTDAELLDLTEPFVLAAQAPVLCQQVHVPQIGRSFMLNLVSVAILSPIIQRPVCRFNLYR